jgi:hypothetical protein
VSLSALTIQPEQGIIIAFVPNFSKKTELEVLEEQAEELDDAQQE